MTDAREITRTDEAFARLVINSSVIAFGKILVLGDRTERLSNGNTATYLMLAQ